MFHHPSILANSCGIHRSRHLLQRVAPVLLVAAATVLSIGRPNLGAANVNWNGEIKPGPRKIGFDYNFIMPATGDRVPCVYIEDRRIVNLDPKDSIEVSYRKQVGNEPTGREHPELLKMTVSRGQGHDGTIVNGIGRIGFMSGGKSARWDDETMAATLTGKACAFIEKNKDRPFFLYFATHDIHVPRVPAPQFRGSSGCGVRGDVIQQSDWSVGEVVKTMERLGLSGNTLLVVTSDNGPVLNDAYDDDADRISPQLGLHAAGPLRGGKYTIWEGGTRIPWIACWPGRIKAGGKSDALICQVDMLSTSRPNSCKTSARMARNNHTRAQAGTGTVQFRQVTVLVGTALRWFRPTGPHTTCLQRRT